MDTYHPFSFLLEGISCSLTGLFSSLRVSPVLFGSLLFLRVTKWRNVTVRRCFIVVEGLHRGKDVSNYLLTGMVDW